MRLTRRRWGTRYRRTTNRMAPIRPPLLARGAADRARITLLGLRVTGTTSNPFLRFIESLPFDLDSTAVRPVGSWPLDPIGSPRRGWTCVGANYSLFLCVCESMCFVLVVVFCWVLMHRISRCVIWSQPFIVTWSFVFFFVKIKKKKNRWFLKDRFFLFRFHMV